MLRVLLAISLATSIQAQSPCPRGDLPAYAHNDYANAHPLTDALAFGYRGAEADIFLVDGALRVGHDRRAARAGAAFESLYLVPLHEIAGRCAQLTSDGRPWLLAVEIKEQSPATYDSLVALLDRYRSLIEPNAGQAADPSVAPKLLVVLVGWHPKLSDDSGIPHLLGTQQRIATVSEVPPSLNKTTRLLSIDYGKTVGRWWVTAGGRRKWIATLRAAKASAPDHLLRAHNVPADARTYSMLMDAGVDLIGTKELPRTAELLRGIVKSPDKDPH